MKTVHELSEALQNGSLTSEALVNECLHAIEEQNDAINAFIWLSPTAVEDARVIDARRAAGESLHPLAGIPIGIKDNILVQGWEVTAGSQMLEGHKAAYDATVIRRLKDAGMILLGRTNMDEFAMGSSTETSHYGPTKNPHDQTKIPGGTSGGSAAAVAAGMVPCALGTDTGGSIRQPAAMCGVSGLKPTYGRVPRYGLIANVSSFDQIGPIAQTAEDCALIMQVIEGIDEKDATSAPLTQTSVPELIPTNVEGLRVGLPEEYFVEGMHEEIRARIDEVVAVLKNAGAIIQDVSIPHAKDALAAYYILQPAEASSNLGRFDGLRYGYRSQGRNLAETYEHSRGEGMGAEVKRRIMLGSYVLSAGYVDAYYKQAARVRTLIKQDFDTAFQEVDVILTPTSPSVAWTIGEKSKDPLTMYLSDIYTITANLATVPAISIPCGTAEGLPVGVQLTAKPFNEEALYRAAMFIEREQRV